VAVLPFENLGDTSMAYFADGITDEVRGKLAALPGLEVIARTSSAQYKRTPKSPQQIGQELGVRYLLTATVRWQRTPSGASRVRVSPELIEVRTAATTWQEPFDAALTDVFGVQTEIAGRVVQALGVALGAGERRRLAERPTDNLAAYDAYLKGEEVSRGATDPVTLRRAVNYYEQAIALDSTFALAWASLSQGLTQLYFNGTPSPTDAERSRVAAQRAIALAPDRPVGRLALGYYYQGVQRDNDRALREYILGLQLAPANPDLLFATATVEQFLGRWEAAAEHFRDLWTINPRSENTIQQLGIALLWLRRYPEALAVTDRGLSLVPTDLAALENKAMVHLAQGNLAGAQAVLQVAPKEVEPTALAAFFATYLDLFWVLDDEQQELLLRLTPGPFGDDRGAWGLALAATYAHRGDGAKARAYADSARVALEAQLKRTPENAETHALLGVALAYLGHHERAVREGRRGVELLPITKDAYTGAYIQHQLARIYLLVGDPEKTLDHLEPLLKLPYFLSPGWLRIDPMFDPLRDNPRFQRLVNGS
jgi:serine/threonine-protein kinase